MGAGSSPSLDDGTAKTASAFFVDFGYSFSIFSLLTLFLNNKRDL
jgi:hypothetical protein